MNVLLQSLYCTCSFRKVGRCENVAKSAGSNLTIGYLSDHGRRSARRKCVSCAKENSSLIYGLLLEPDLENPLEIQASLKYCALKTLQ
jgi:hypothetical protein